MFLYNCAMQPKNVERDQTGATQNIIPTTPHTIWRHANKPHHSHMQHKQIHLLQEAGGYITSNTITISRPWRITTKIRYGHLLQVPLGDRQDSLVSTVVTHVRYADGQPSCPQSRGSVRCCDGRPGRPKVMATGPPPGCYTTCCHAQLQNIRTRNTQTLGF